MKRIIFIAGLLLGALSIQNTANAQQIREQAVSIDKVNQNAVVGTFKAGKSVLEAVMQKRMTDAKLGKGKSFKGFRKYEGVIWSEISADKMDYYYRVTGKKDNASVEILASKGYNNFVSSQSDAATIQNINSFVSSLEADIVKYNINELIAAKEKEIKEAEKVEENRKNDISKAEKALEAARAESAKQNEIVNRLKGELQKLKGQL